MMNFPKKGTPTFKAYVDVEEYGPNWNGTHPEDTEPIPSEPSLLTGEIVIACAKSTLKFAPFSDLKHGILGSLFVTNYRLCFISVDNSSNEMLGKGIPNALLDQNDICLSNVESVHQLSENGVKRKLLQPNSSPTSRVEIIQISCRDLRVHAFSFKLSSLGQDTSVMSAILHHAFPTRVQLLFAFSYRKRTPVDQDGLYGRTVEFDSLADYSVELNRTKATHYGWRLSHVNETFHLCTSMPSVCVVPKALVDDQLSQCSAHFNDNRIPLWCWNSVDGVALARMASLRPALTDTSSLTMLLDSIRKCHPWFQPCHVEDMGVGSGLPGVKDLQHSYTKLRELCMPSSQDQFWEQENRFLSHLDATRWFQAVQTCLQIAERVAVIISVEKVSVVLTEQNDIDFNCVIASLVQIILDAHWRTVAGFQALIQKEWISRGHPFALRLGLVGGQKQEQSPVFLLFLDCVWQLTQRYKTTFQFTEIYLTTLWDSCHNSLFDTFAYNSQKHKRDIWRNPDSNSVWNWDMQFTREQQKSLFTNPLYSLFHHDTALVDFVEKPSEEPNGFGCDADKTRMRQSLNFSLGEKDPLSKTNSLPKSRSTNFQRFMTKVYPNRRNENTVVFPDTKRQPAALWSMCYLRWLPFVCTLGESEHLKRNLLVKEIRTLERGISALESGAGNVQRRKKEAASVEFDGCDLELAGIASVPTLYPFYPGGVPYYSGDLASPNRIDNSFYVLSDDEVDE